MSIDIVPAINMLKQQAAVHDGISERKREEIENAKAHLSTLNNQLDIALFNADAFRKAAIMLDVAQAEGQVVKPNLEVVDLGAKAAAKKATAK